MPMMKTWLLLGAALLLTLVAGFLLSLPRGEAAPLSAIANFDRKMRVIERPRVSRRRTASADGRKQRNFASVSRILPRLMKGASRRRYSRAEKKFLLRCP